MNTKIVVGLIQAGRVLNKLNKPVSNELRYHLLADAIYWADELPDVLSAEAENSVRVVIRYRTCLILEMREEQWRPYWDLAQHLFPKWIGFVPERRKPNKKLKVFYQERAKPIVGSGGKDRR